jgi:putative phage-type endonuclease
LIPNTAEWLMSRKEGIGASDAPIIMGVSEYGSSLDLFLEKTTDIIKEPTFPMLHGKKYEPTAIAMFVEKTGINVAYNTSDCFVWSKKNHFQFATFDFLVAGGGFGEVKCPLKKAHYEMAKQGKVPLIHNIQMQHQLAVDDKSEFAYYVLLWIDRRNHNNDDFVIIKNYRDENLIKEILEEEEIWFDSYLAAGIAPPPTLIQNVG